MTMFRTPQDRQRIAEAGALLQLGEKASPIEIKQAYRRLCKLHHPDTSTHSDDKDGQIVQQITQAYQLLMDYCEQYQVPLAVSEDQEPPDIYDPESWWHQRFGESPMWGSGSKRNK